MLVIVAQSAGFCYGVNRAVKMCEESAEHYINCVMLGSIIHNKHVINDLNKRGIRTVSDISEISKDDVVIIRSHGASKDEYESLASMGVRFIDATCPDVKRIHEIVCKQSQEGRLMLVIGQRNHPEVSAICSWCSEYKVFETPEELKNWLGREQNSSKSISMVFQTTSTKSVYDDFVALVKKECTNPIIFDTICNATYHRQEEAVEISKTADIIIVVGDTDSANSLKLKQICAQYCNNVIFAQSADDIDTDLFNDKSVVGITAGASTPAFIIKEVIAKMSKEEIMDGTHAEPARAEDVALLEILPEPEKAEKPITEELKTEEPIKNENKVEEPKEEKPNEEELKEEGLKIEDTKNSNTSQDETLETQDDSMESFEELLEKSIKTLRTGEKVAGSVTSITSTEVSVDLGTKQSGYIPIVEFLDEENNDINEIIKIGDTIEAFVTRVNDVEGMVSLSKRRLDAAKNWDVVESARENRETVTGVVVEENRGGVVVNVKGVRVFVPASQTGLPKNTPMSEILRKTVKLRINEVNQSRKRVVGSIRDAQKDERREKSEKVWNEIEVDKKYDGVVKSMTSYGVFVDIGGVDGMIHISELSWTRIKQPSEILSVGDEISVYVISFDKENRKISLGYKKGEDNPWTKFTSEHSVGDVINVKIVKMMPFGSFAEICSGVDGLIHVSQIADHRIDLPSEVLSEGQMVDVKITEIDNERKKVSLSIKALLDSIIERESSADSPDKAQDNIDDNTPVIVYDTDSPPPPDDGIETSAE